ncbi:methyltransferase [Actinophytocola sp.]|uniref:methyltransferase n=1 Tax=Actinophytocola sp. TaxID=1872138 RepID=UPI002D810C32|nr:methyltransferase [Actinophytocola sp.]HET9141282.1 methyltransferase [Actinophytocola sp.]
MTDNPGALLGQAMAFQQAKLVLTGLEIGLFQLLSDGPVTEPRIRARLGLHPRGTGHFLLALVELGVLRRDGDAFANTEAVQRFLVPGQSDGYMGGFLTAANRVMYPAWGRLADALRTGEPQAATYTGEQDMFDQLYGNEEKKSDFVSMAEDASRPLIPALAEAFDWGAHRSVLELGGCRGNVLAHIVRQHPHLDGTVLDLPQLEPAFDEHMANLGMTGKLRFHSADFFNDELPRHDVLAIGHCMVDWTDDQRAALIKNVFPAVKPGGAFLVWDPIIVDGADSYLRNLVRSLNLQLMTPHGVNYRLAPFTESLREAGFDEVTHRSIGNDVTLVVARKQSDG